MRLFLYFITIHITIVHITSLSNVIDDHSSAYKSSKREHNDINKRKMETYNDYKKRNAEVNDDKAADRRVEMLKRLKNYQKQVIKAAEVSNIIKDADLEKHLNYKDPFFNYLRRTRNARRADISSEFDTSETSSSSIETPNWKDEWKKHWLQKKLEAINTSMPKGDTVNMVAARPWGVPCGDPNQHDAPWGSCMLPMECEAEYRIYRGDYFCGRTMFICCALQVTNYDMYGGFDVSFADSSLATDSDEKKNRDRGSKERKRRKRLRDKKRRARERLKRKRKIKRTIGKIMREIRKILSRSFRNRTTARKRKTKQLKKFIKDMKKQYVKERKNVRDIHEMELIKIDAALQKRLNEIMGMNQEYVRNQTFRDIVVNGTISKQNVKRLVNAYPKLADIFNRRRSGIVKRPRDYLEYDIEYGYLYY